MDERSITLSQLRPITELRSGTRKAVEAFGDMSTLAYLLPTDSPNDPAVTIPGSPSQTITYDHLTTQCRSLQQQLADLGIGHGTAVSISLPNSFEFVAVFLAICWQRAIAAPLNPAYKEDEVLFYVDDLDAAAVIVPTGACQSAAPAVLAARKRNAAVIECYAEGDQVRFDVKEPGGLQGREKKGLEVAEEEDVALVLHTSGTTGRPKAVLTTRSWFRGRWLIRTKVPLTHKNLSVSVDNIVKTYQLTKTDRTMVIMPLFHVHGLVASFMANLKAGSAVIIPPRLAPSFWKDFEAHKATWYSATPTMHKILLSFPPPDPVPTVRFIRSCSSPLSPQTMEKLESTFKAPVLEAYAMTEASHQITSNPLPPASHYPGSVGIPGPYIEVRILSMESDEQVEKGKEGEVCVRSSSVTTGYLSNPEANASSFTKPGFFRTGDCGRFDENGYLILTGRIKEFINKGGEKVSPVEVDNLISQHPAVAEVVAFAIEDEMYGQEVGAAVLLKEGEELKARDLQKWVRGRVAPLKVPKK
ncbi:MAG: hypothetical protein Q9181_005491, partial [Wetmoreana brouardii]